MRGTKQSQVSVACLINVETMIPEDHPIRAIKRLLDEVLAEIDSQLRRDVRGERPAFDSAGVSP